MRQPLFLPLRGKKKGIATGRGLTNRGGGTARSPRKRGAKPRRSAEGLLRRPFAPCKARCVPPPRLVIRCVGPKRKPGLFAECDSPVPFRLILFRFRSSGLRWKQPPFLRSVPYELSTGALPGRNLLLHPFYRCIFQPVSILSRTIFSVSTSSFGQSTTVCALLVTRCAFSAHSASGVSARESE